MIEIHTRNFDLHITVPSPNLALLCRNLDYKPYVHLYFPFSGLYLYVLYDSFYIALRIYFFIFRPVCRFIEHIVLVSK